MTVEEETHCSYVQDLLYRLRHYGGDVGAISRETIDRVYDWVRHKIERKVDWNIQPTVFQPNTRGKLISPGIDAVLVDEYGTPACGRGKTLGEALNNALDSLQASGS